MQRQMPQAWLENQKALHQNSQIAKLRVPTIEAFKLAQAQGCLFHGTPSRAMIKSFKLLPTHLHDERVVFAGPAWVALAFTATWDDNSLEMGTVNDLLYIHISSQNVYNAFLKDGFVYQLPPTTFFHTNRLTSFE